MQMNSTALSAGPYGAPPRFGGDDGIALTFACAGVPPPARIADSIR